MRRSELRSMTMWTSSSSRRHWTPGLSNECAPLELERRSSYATFGRIFPSKRTDRCNQPPLWTLTSVVIGAILLYRSMTSHSSTFDDIYDTSLPVTSWDHNHYEDYKQLNLLITQIAPIPFYGDITSRPNRAYAKRWGWDFLFHTGHDDDGEECTAVRILNHVVTQQERHSGETRQQRAPYDAVLVLSQDAVIMDMDYELLALLPNDKLVAIGEKPDIFLWNLQHSLSPTVARLWLDGHADCSTQSLTDAIELVMEQDDDTDEADLNLIVQPLALSESEGLVQPRFIKFLPPLEEKNIPETVATLQSVADSVCYRYYPRCEVL